jgi:hypothetical protein
MNQILISRMQDYFYLQLKLLLNNMDDDILHKYVLFLKLFINIYSVAPIIKSIIITIIIIINMVNILHIFVFIIFLYKLYKLYEKFNIIFVHFEEILKQKLTNFSHLL